MDGEEKDEGEKDEREKNGGEKDNDEVRNRSIITSYGITMTRQDLITHWKEWTLEDLKYIWCTVNGGPERCKILIKKSSGYNAEDLKRYLYEGACKICGYLSHEHTTCPKEFISTDDYCNECESYGHLKSCRNKE